MADYWIPGAYNEWPLLVNASLFSGKNLSFLFTFGAYHEYVFP